MISDKNKKILGKLFKKYKEDQNISTIDIEHASISSINTYYNACKGEIIKNDEFYINYCKFFNHPLEINNIIDNWINEFDGKLYHVIDFLDNKAIKDLYDEFNIKLNDYKDYAIYHEYHYMIDLLCNYYISNRYLNLEEIYDVLDLVDIKLFSDELSILLLDISFRTNNNFIGNKELPNKILQRMEHIDKDSYYTLFVNGAVEKYGCNFMQALTYFNKSYDISRNKKNTNREIQSLMAVYGIYRNTDKKAEEYTANELLRLKNEQIPDKIKQSINYNVGMQDYLVARYERAYKLFVENIETYHSYNCLLFLCSVCSRLSKEYPELLISKKIEDRYDFVYLNYFRKKLINYDYIDLAEYILQEIFVDKLQYEKYREPYWNLFEYELNEMTKKDIKVRKLYLEYLNLMKTTCEN